MDTSTEPIFPSKSYALSGKIMLIAIIVLFFVMILILLLHLYARWYLRQRQPRHIITHRPRHVIFHSPDSTSSSPRGLDKAVLASLPVVEYAHEEAGCVYSTPSTLPALEECSVCLSEFETGEKVRFLPKCGHGFHIDCIDMWFHSHATCPVCRSVVEKIDGELVLSGDKRWRNRRMRIEVPSRTEFMKSESGLSSSPASQGFWTPGKRILSLNRIFSMGKKSADDSPVVVGDGPSNCDPDEMDLECGVNESTHRSHTHTPR